MRLYIDKDLIKEADQWLDIAWIWEKNHSARTAGAALSHPFAEIVLLIGSDPKNTERPRRWVEWGMGEGRGARNVCSHLDHSHIRA
jgi:hypothetical protein